MRHALAVLALALGACEPEGFYSTGEHACSSALTFEGKPLSLHQAVSEYSNGTAATRCYVDGLTSTGYTVHSEDIATSESSDVPPCGFERDGRQWAFAFQASKSVVTVDGAPVAELGCQ